MILKTYKNNKMKYYQTKCGFIVDENLNKDFDQKEYKEFLSKNGTLIELEELTQYDKDALNEDLKNEYSKKISEIDGLTEAIERKSFDDTPIPSHIVYERELLKSEYNEKKYK